MKWLSTARHSMSLWAPFRFLTGSILMIAEIFLGLALMSCSKTMKPRSLLVRTPNVHFSRLSLM